MDSHRKATNRRDRLRLSHLANALGSFVHNDKAEKTTLGEQVGRCCTAPIGSDMIICISIRLDSLWESRIKQRILRGLHEKLSEMGCLFHVRSIYTHSLMELLILSQRAGNLNSYTPEWGRFKTERRGSIRHSFPHPHQNCFHRTISLHSRDHGRLAIHPCHTLSHITRQMAYYNTTRPILTLVSSFRPYPPTIVSGHVVRNHPAHRKTGNY